MLHGQQHVKIFYCCSCCFKSLSIFIVGICYGLGSRWRVTLPVKVDVCVSDVGEVLLVPAKYEALGSALVSKDQTSACQQASSSNSFLAVLTFYVARVSLLAYKRCQRSDIGATRDMHCCARRNGLGSCVNI